MWFSQFMGLEEQTVSTSLLAWVAPWCNKRLTPAARAQVTQRSRCIVAACVRFSVKGKTYRNRAEKKESRVKYRKRGEIRLKTKETEEHDVNTRRVRERRLGEGRNE